MNELPKDVDIGLKIALYDIFYLSNSKLENLPPFGESQVKYYRNSGSEKINEIGKALEWAEAYPNYAYNKIYPRHSNINNDIIYDFLMYTLNGLIDNELYHRKQK
ncbi:hypothetical protein [Thalassolituus sp.]|uniref:hypothetical protein n=1 Tax=Thalassolituus sp. TaxID=2030822 RepID=UPI0035132063